MEASIFATPPCVPSAIHFTHSACADRQDYVWTQLVARGQRHTRDSIQPIQSSISLAGWAIRKLTGW